MKKMIDDKSIELMVANHDSGYARATSDEKYAYIGESLTLEHAIAQPEYANLTIYGGLLNSVTFGVGLRKNSPYTDELSLAILGEYDCYLSFY